MKPGEATTCPKPVSTAGAALVKTPWLGLELYCDGERLPVYDRSNGSGHGVAEVTIGAAPFEIRSRTLPEDGMGICAWTDDSIFAKISGGRGPQS